MGAQDESGRRSWRKDSPRKSSPRKCSARKGDFAEGSTNIESAEKYRIVKKKKWMWSKEVRVDLSHCKYDVLRVVIKKFGWEEAFEDNRLWHLYWTDTSIGPERLMLLKRGQKVNHFFGMLQICRKKALARNLSTMRRMFPLEYRFFPRAYILPNQTRELLACFNAPKLRTYILKPDSGSQGRGVVLVQSVSDVKQAMGGLAGSDMLAQKYLTNPMLLNGYKFDLRIYTLIVSCDPLRLFLYREGLVRFCTEKYMKPTRDNLKHSCMHLTNYSLNKYNPNFEFNQSATEVDKGSKWSLSSLFETLAARGFDTKKLRRQIKKMAVMTLIAIVPYLVHNYKTCLSDNDSGRACFELLGMDVLVDDKCRPWLLEVNHSPSFSIDTPLDLKVKEALITDTLRLVHIDPSGISKEKLQDKKVAKIRLYNKHHVNGETPVTGIEGTTVEAVNIKEMEEYEMLNMGNFDRIYPPDDINLQKLYSIFLAGSEEAFKHSFDMKVKNAIAKVQEEWKQVELDKENEEKRKNKLRALLRKKAQESARLAALYKKSLDPAEMSADLEVPSKHRDGIAQIEHNAQQDVNQNFHPIFGRSTALEQGCKLQMNEDMKATVASNQQWNSGKGDLFLALTSEPVRLKMSLGGSVSRIAHPFIRAAFTKAQVGLKPPRISQVNFVQRPPEQSASISTCPIQGNMHDLENGSCFCRRHPSGRTEEKVRGSSLPEIRSTNFLLARQQYCRPDLRGSSQHWQIDPTMLVKGLSQGQRAFQKPRSLKVEHKTNAFTWTSATLNDDLIKAQYGSQRVKQSCVQGLAPHLNGGFRKPIKNFAAGITSSHLGASKGSKAVEYLLPTQQGSLLAPRDSMVDLRPIKNRLFSMLSKSSQ